MRPSPGGRRGGRDAKDKGCCWAPAVVSWPCERPKEVEAKAAEAEISGLRKKRAASSLALSLECVGCAVRAGRDDEAGGNDGAGCNGKAGCDAAGMVADCNGASI